MNKLFLILATTALFLNAQEVGLNCLIIKEEGSIICKYTQERELEDRLVKINWIDPSNKISRKKSIKFKAGHGSVYDFRYMKGRMFGIWTVEVKDKDKDYNTTFELTK
jgi:hypothetical protein